MRVGFWRERLSYSLRDYGLAGTVLRVFDLLSRQIVPLERNFDKLYGVRTAGRVGAPELGISREANEYGPTPVRPFLSLIRKLPIRYSEWHFIDIGCGRGRGVILAATFPFQSAAGVELSPSLVETAQSNVAAFRKDPRCVTSSVDIFRADALSFPIPSPSVVYLNSPFYGSMMARFVEHLLASPSQAYVVYWNPRCRAMFLRPEFQEIKRRVNYSIFRRELPTERSH